VLLPFVVAPVLQLVQPLGQVYARAKVNTGEWIVPLWGHPGIGANRIMYL